MRLPKRPGWRSTITRAQALQCLGFAALLLFAAPVSADPVVSQFAQSWQQAAQFDSQPARATEVWRSFAQQHAEHDLGKLARLMQGLWTLRQGDRAAALPLLQLPAPVREGPTASSPLYGHIHHGAQVAATRIDMMNLADRLQDYYRRHVEYPATLDDLVAAKLASPQDLTDRFGHRFDYRPAARLIMPNQPRQTYALRSQPAGAERGQMPALLDRLNQPVRELSISSLVAAQGQAFVRDRRGDGTWGPAQLWRLGQQRGDMVLWAVYDTYLIAGWHGVPVLVQRESN
jgi:hypothetical protein